MRKTFVIVVCFILLMAGSAPAASRDHITEKIALKDANELVITCDLGAGEFSIEPGDIEEAAIIDIIYDSRRVDYIVDYTEKRGKCYIDLKSERRSSTNIDTEDNVWDIVLSKRYPVVLEMDMGACDASIDMGGIPLKELKLDVGAASGTLEFSEPNPIRLEEMDIDAGASSLKIRNLGNANFDYFNFDGGVGSFELDLRGKYNGKSEVSVDIGLGSADIIMPEGVPFRIESEGGKWLSSINIHNRDMDEVDDNIYESANFADAETRIILELSVGLGSVDIYWK